MSKLCPVCGTTYADANVFCPADGTTLRAAELDADLIGTVVADRYLVTDLLGEGGMGKVYLARHVRLPQQAAIKVLRSAMLKDGGAVARFNREAANASRIDHDRVARVYDFGEAADGMVYLAMEYVAGRTLKKMLAETGPLEPRRAAALVRQIGEALDAAHRLGIVHRDLKPDNVMIVEDADGTERVKVVDFGIAKALGADDQGAGLTQAGYVVGTPEFMSPEQLVGGQIDARSDVYALAIVAYHCFTGTAPFDSSTPEKAMAARFTDAPMPLSRTQPAVPWPDTIQAVFDAGLARDVEERTPGAGVFARQLAEAVEAWLPSGQGVRPLVTPSYGSPATVPPPVSSPAPSPVPSRAAAPVPGPVAAPAPRPDTAAPAKRPPVALIGGLVVAAVVVGGFLWSQGRGAPASQPSAQSPTPPSTQSPPPVTRPVATADGTPSTPAPVPAAVPNETSTSPAPRPGPPTSAPPPRTAEAPIAAAGFTSAADRRTLDSLSTAFDPERMDEATARAAIPVLRRMLPRLGTRDDSTWAHIRLIEANALTNNNGAACSALRAARGTASTAKQREIIANYAGVLGCTARD